MMGIGNDYVNVSLSNCVVVDNPQDSVSSIMDAGKDIANCLSVVVALGLIFLICVPRVLPLTTLLGLLLGLGVLLIFYSYVCRMIGQNGRRGALMISMDIRHPGHQKFVKMKHDLTKVTGANVSVKITTSLWKQLEKGEQFTLTVPG